ncbi:hypothetical protein LXL04_023154 [Taraxacum kok-saghyz]
MSSSSSSSSHYLDAVPHCDCKPPLPVKERVSWKPSNPGRRFLNCPMSLISDDHCEFFDWIDPPVTEHYRKTLNQLCAMANGQPLRMQRRLTRAEEQLHVAITQRNAAEEHVIQLLEENHRLRTNSRVHQRVLVLLTILVCLMLVVIGVGMIRG